jgi:sugar phosphate isomerase/epimerase
LRDERYASLLKACASPCKNTVGNITVFAMNDCDRTVSQQAMDALSLAEGASIVFMHHPMDIWEEPCKSFMIDWREKHPNARIFYGHKHRPMRNGNVIALQAMDPDKAIGENACITYYDTVKDELQSEYFISPVPRDFCANFGVSCYNMKEHISFSAENRLKNMELRKNCIEADREELKALVDEWRHAGGENLSIHLPDISYADGKPIPHERLSEYMELAELLGANRFTQHVPKVLVKTVKENPDALNKMAECLAGFYNSVEWDIVIGVENMHMTKKDTPGDNRRYGYIPEEVIEFMQLIGSKCRHKVGINFDIGHARNNAPYSQKYQISTWFSMIGKYVVGYHMHQVNSEPGSPIENHLPITSIYGRLISYGSFFRCWENGTVNKAPIIFEMRPEGAYEQTLKTFAPYR